jgi:uncharacterized metal-binding protein YceD (DUF177 family)
VSQAWTKPLHLYEIARGPISVRLEPDEADRAQIAKALGLQSLPSLTAQLTVKPWMDGVEITGRFEAVVEQLCAVSLDPFEQPLSGEIDIRAVPAGSAQAEEPTGGEMEYDLETPDPPDVLESDEVDLAAYVVEHLALEIDPFARKPGVEFDYTPPSEPDSPFAVLKKLKGEEP